MESSGANECNGAVVEATRRWWAIDVDGYGRFAYYGDEAEADTMRADKAHWEGGAATLEPVDWDDPCVVKQVRWVFDVEIPHGYPRAGAREAAETAAILKYTRTCGAVANDSRTAGATTKRPG